LGRSVEITFMDPQASAESLRVLATVRCVVAMSKQDVGDVADGFIFLGQGITELRRVYHHQVPRRAA
jgi:hypothetical protein